MNVVAIDPGSKLMGWSEFQLNDKLDVTAMRCDVLDLSRIESFATIADMLNVRMAGADVVALETPGQWLGYQKVSRSLAGVAVLYQMIGVVRLCAEREAKRVIVLTDSDVKYALTGRKNASKYEVHNWLKVFGRYEIPALRKTTCDQCRGQGVDADHSPDAADAAAIGHVACDLLRNERDR